MNTYCCYTPAHKILFDNYFLPTAPPSLTIHPTLIDLSGAGDFLSPEFLECIRKKMDLVIESIRANAGHLILWSDVDIVFMRDPRDELVRLAASSNSDLYFQREAHDSPDVNAGFILIRCNEATVVFFEKVKFGMLASPSENEQSVINKILAGTSEFRWEKLPWSFFAKSHCWPPPSDAYIYHANATSGKDAISQKIAQFRDLEYFQRHGFPALCLIMIKKLPKYAGTWVRRAIIEPLFRKQTPTP